ncbi:TadE/TadG family type IV pilus assembly protein [Arthrobacter sp. UC242_113]|uniref:TadE/TadG family type IV pilus assembly protein n=1 Tax=Arthrobacter sp. UC242_113 TaxID=3374550 RepID=UPI003757B040
MSRGSDRGAVAVEFALLAPVLIMLLLGIMEFGRAYNTQITLSNAAREGARVMAIDNKQADAEAAATRASAGLGPLTMKFSTYPTASTPANCSSGSQVTLVVTYSLNTITGISGPFAMQGKGTMLCGG